MARKGWLKAKTRFDLGRELLRQVHTIGNSNDEKLRISHSRPVEKVVDHVLFGREQLIELIHEDNAVDNQLHFHRFESGNLQSMTSRASRSTTLFTEMSLQSLQSRLRADTF